MASSEEMGAYKGGRPRSVQSQQAILDATLSLLATEGFDAMSIEAIASHAGVGKKTIYRWWASKEELVIDAIKSLQQAKNPVIDTGSLHEDLVTMFRNAFQTWSGPHTRGLAINLLGIITNHPEVYRAFYEQAIAPRFQQMMHVIQRAQARGEIRQDLDINDIIGLLAGPLWFRLFFDVNNLPLEPDLAERLVDAALHGITRQRAPEEDNTKAASHYALE